MNIRNIKQYIIAGSICCGTAAALTACADWNDHYDDANAAEGSTLTLWQQLKAEPQLSDFCQVLEQTKLFRMHRKTVVSYADLLSSGQSFTVVAPVNGTFNKDSLLQLVQTAQGDSMVEKAFVQNHLSRSLSSVTAEPQQIRLLNTKYMTSADGQIGGVGLSSLNRHAKNGIMHVAQRPLPYMRSLYESLSDLSQFSAIGRQLRQYEEDYFDADASVSSGIIEGVPVYVDSVVIERNRMLERIGYLDAEDSLYWAVAPSADGWQQAWDEASRYFVYDEQMLKRDSLQQYWTTRALLDDAVFNMTDQLSTNDSLVSVQYLQSRLTAKVGKPVNHVFRRPFEAGGILYGAQPIACSNGVLYQTQTWPFTPEQTYFKELWSEAEDRSLITAEKDCSYNARLVAADSVSEGSYLQILPRTTTSNWELTFRVNNTLSADYDICAIILPQTVGGQVANNSNPCKFRAYIDYVDESGKSKTFDCGKTQFTTHPERVDTVVLAEAFHLPTCNYDQNDIKVTVRLQCNILARETSRYSREMYLDCIYLRPRKMKVEN